MPQSKRELTGQELNTILAALRFYQEKGQGDPANRSEAIHDIATNGDTEISMDAEGIDELCETLNTSDISLSRGIPTGIKKKVKEFDVTNVTKRTNQALAIVLELATENALDPKEHRKGSELREQAELQHKALFHVGELLKEFRQGFPGKGLDSYTDYEKSLVRTQLEIRLPWILKLENGITKNRPEPMVIDDLASLYEALKPVAKQKGKKLVS